MASTSSDGTSWISPGEYFEAYRAGITADYSPHSETLRILVVFLCGLSLYNSVELVIIVFMTFTRFQGPYFWSFLISTLGIIPYSLGFLLKYMNITTGESRWLPVSIITLGWYSMVIGQSFVLWCRLHLIVTGQKGDKILRYTKWMILINIVCLHLPTTVLTFGANGIIDTQTFVVAYNIMEKVQMTGFFLQETLLSSIYIFETARILRTSLQPGTRRTMKQLVGINAVIIIMDLALLGLEAASLYVLETLLKSVVYGIKLKLEFAILGRLVKFVGGSRPGADLRKTSVEFVSTCHEPSRDNNGLDARDFVVHNTDIAHPSRSHPYSESLPSHMSPSSMIMDHVARFEHIEVVSTLQGTTSRNSPSLSNGNEVWKLLHAASCTKSQPSDSLD
ncbi:hypothetical protein AC578_838 [Lecanosticta acicola]|uniref:DUF7703 domain-containing protein n=1 Tax=Lecanosticta acicola TaxID=111012 RepID=A0AAI8YYS5_9PEZI|nr:hypothetical protein AC578_838 [Lecanosticta acicola]